MDNITHKPTPDNDKPVEHRSAKEPQPTVFEGSSAKASTAQESPVKDFSIHIPTVPESQVKENHVQPQTPIARKRKASQDLTSNPLSKEMKLEEDDSRAAGGKPTIKGSKEEEKAKKMRNIATRTLWSVIMISGFLSRSCMNETMF